MRTTIPPCFRGRSPDDLNEHDPSAANDPPTELDELSIEELAAVAKGLSHPTRLDILAELSDRTPAVAGSIATTSGLARSTVSEHLRLLHQAGLVDRCQEGPEVRYRLKCQRLRSFVAQLNRLCSTHRDFRP